MIHQFKGGHWLPGPDHREGSQPFPAHPAEGAHFNDVSGVVGASVEAVAQDLNHLLMKQGALAQLLPSPPQWRMLMNKVQAHVQQQDLIALKLADVLVRPDESIGVQAAAGWDAAVVNDASRLALSLVRANGQMDFIRRQPWFGTGTHEVVLELLSQFGVSVDHLQFHKDTRGETLFVNLAFRNDQAIPATEWTLDLQDMPPDKEELLERNWPPQLLADLKVARRRLVPKAGEALCIEGGVLPVDGYLSWVDELVWHSIPVLANRMRYSVAQVRTILNDKTYSPATYDVLLQIAQTRGSGFARYLAHDEVAVELLSEALVEKMWHASRADGDMAWLLQTWLADAESIDWERRHHDTASAVALIQTRADSDEATALQQPAGIEGRPRSNSQNLHALLALPGRYAERRILAVVVKVRLRQ